MNNNELEIKTQKHSKWWLIDFTSLPYFKGTYRAGGLKSALTTVSPLLNTIIYWRHRNSKLIIPGINDKEIK